MIFLALTGPNNFAASGRPDVTAQYPSADQMPAFKSVVEVSSKQQPTEAFYLKQLEEAYRHAKPFVKNNDGRPVYALVITQCNVDVSESLQAAYRRFLSDRRQDEQYRLIRVLPLYAVDFAGTMASMLSANTQNFSNDMLAGIFDTLIERLSQEDSPVEPGWMREQWLTLVAEGEPSPPIDDPPSWNGNGETPPLPRPS